MGKSAVQPALRAHRAIRTGRQVGTQLSGRPHILSNGGLFDWFKKSPTRDFQCFSDRVSMGEYFLFFSLVCL